ncbi:hypothetical protein PHYPO_G00116240 [Pangasianodon hypophthalmus]|uniref:Uncharacterized protein n=1 Tax=Pangasianodon hypophthalmus TaxID=310915 RepID=A0A5N5L3M3_PANHP|nr:hypothetical protein PHYPO_G00116240 [Pangasianodon hypophthalmus]
MSSRRARRGEDGEKKRGSRGESFVQPRKRETDAAPAETQRTALVLPVHVMDRPGKSSPCENKTPKRRKDPHRTGQLLKENQSIRVFFFISGRKTIFRTNLYSRFFGLDSLGCSEPILFTAPARTESEVEVASIPARFRRQVGNASVYLRLFLRPPRPVPAEKEEKEETRGAATGLRDRGLTIWD